MSIKFTNEPPAGIKAGLKRTYQNITQDLLDVSNMAAWKPMLYCVSFLHTVVQVTFYHSHCHALYVGGFVAYVWKLSMGYGKCMVVKTSI